MTEADDIALRADKLYAARSALAETERPTRRLGVAEIVQFLNDPRRSLSMEEQRSLFADPQLRADYRRLKSQVTIAELPALAAASAGNVNSRRFEGGTVSIHSSRVPGQVYVVLRFNWPAGPVWVRGCPTRLAARTRIFRRWSRWSRPARGPMARRPSTGIGGTAFFQPNTRA